MTLFILDTDHISLHQHEHPSVTQRLSVISPENLAVTVVTVEEQLRGRLNVIRRAKTEAQLTMAYANLRATVYYFRGLSILNFSQIAYQRYEQLRQQKIRVGTQDLRIAAIALAVGGTLITRNQRDFSQVPGLQWQDWSV